MGGGEGRGREWVEGREKILTGKMNTLNHEKALTEQSWYKNLYLNICGVFFHC